ncbi:MAG TPA: MBOAT family O-acyltransferase [Rhodopila sp.]|uniref:MBOAT family O-acyltransferase n=1 Tax=Rhodopila sp. TaxID=2480087 RepID=UPI002C3A647C|nr:MBOAT family O-acyltransferase [Rhodopila sp.]HVY18046.1 MBOAT family O-acyltransferase [Rhodopila sp.]
MLFPSPVFLIGFLPVTLAGFLVINRFACRGAALAWLVAASLAFYGWWNPWHLPLLAGSILVNHAIVGRIRASACPRRWLVAGLALNLGLLGWFKYADFLLHIARPAAPSLGIILPLAISFFTFQQVMFLVDAARDPAQPRPALLSYAAFVTFFPHLIAGPIVRPSEIIPQLTRDSRFDPDGLTEGLLTFLLGLARKCVLADLFGGFADTGFDAAAAGHDLTLFEAWYATLSYALQIYFDFAGYSDMALGLARMFGIRFPLNFDSPYQARNISEFWRRWHITLGAFLRDYLYIPLGGNRRRHAVNLMATMLLAGLWHGAGWNFVLWGGLHGAMLALHAQYRRLFRPLPARVGQALTLLAVILAWVPFRAATAAASWRMLEGLAGLNGIALPRMIVSAMPPLAIIADPVSVMPSLGDARTLSFPEITACLALGWFIVLCLPNIHRMSLAARHWALTSGFALSVQAVFFAPHVAPFLYFRF